MPYFPHDNLNFYYEESGDGAPFVFSHGLSGNVANARDLVGPVAGFRTIFYDNRGHGRTAESGDVDRLNFSTMAGDVLALLDRLSIEKVVIGGVSMGAGIALAFCLQHPERTRAAILVRPAWLNQAAPPNLAIFPVIARMIEEAGIERGRKLFEQSEIFRKWKEDYPPAVDLVDSLFTGRSPEAIVATYRAIPGSAPYRSPEHLRGVQVPVLILANRQDSLHPFEYAQTLVLEIPGSQFREFPSKTEGLEKHTAAFRAHLEEFLGGLELP